MNDHIGKLGLENNGNTCYLNACLQLISHSGFFVHRMFKEVCDNGSKVLNEVEREILNLLLEKWISKNKIYNPIKIQISIAKKNDLFNPVYREQNDSSEALIYIIDSIEHKPLREVFESSIQSIRQCTRCKKESKTSEIFTILSLDMTDNINKSIGLFEKTEKLDGKVHCDNCNSKQDYTKTYKISKLANNLIIHMKRFQPRNNQYIKDNRCIKIEDIIVIEDISYELRGINIHNGRIGGGHCFFAGKNLINGWNMYDDISCYEIPLKMNDYERNGYLFLYEKIKNY